MTNETVNGSKNSDNHYFVFALGVSYDDVEAHVDEFNKLLVDTGATKHCSFDKADFLEL